ncbi:hypothetical protein GM30_06800 [Trabulsiella odontotermitis]|nr:hypothetical protein GM30_06800 [Trabulsiella odontotermitis]
MIFPMERRARKYITGDVVEVESTAYYRRAVAAGDLVLVTVDEQVTAKAAPAPAQVKKEIKAEPNE